jgi:hypothetical protein
MSKLLRGILKYLLVQLLGTALDSAAGDALAALAAITFTLI